MTRPGARTDLSHHPDTSDSQRAYPNFHRAYVETLRQVFTDPTYRNAPRGFTSIERLGVQYRLADATQRLAFIPRRRLNVVFNYAEALWYLSGSDDLEAIAYYAPSMRRYSMDGRTLTGTAYGRAIFAREDGHHQPDQWRTVVDQLREDPDSKRAVLQIFAADELTVPGNIDVSCTLGLQFLLREGRLHAVSFMRANDAYRGMVSDVFSFTFLQEVLARELDVNVGGYVHVVGSMHVYSTDDANVRQVLADPASRQDAPFRIPAMPHGDNWPWIKEVLAQEKALRDNRLRLDPGRLDAGLPQYWRQVLLLFEVLRRIQRDERVDEELIATLDPAHQWLVAHRWPEHIEVAAIGTGGGGGGGAGHRLGE
jgi:thymidylate synthase